MRALRQIFILFLVLAWTLSSTACSEDKPSAPAGKEKKAGPAKEARKKAAEEGKKADKAEKKATPEAGKEGDAGKKTTEGVKAGDEEVEGAVKPPKDVHLERTLRRVTAYGVTGPIAQVRKSVVGLLPVDARAKVEARIDKGLADFVAEKRLKNLDWLDTTRGIAFAFEGKDKPLIALPLVDSGVFEAALPDNAKKDENQGYKMGDAYVIPYGRHLFISHSFRTIDVIEGDLKLELTRIDTDQLVRLYLGGDSLKTLVSSLLNELEREFSETMPMQQEQKEFLAKFFNFIKEVLGEVELLTITTGLDEQDLVARYELTAVAGSKLAQSMLASKPGKFEAAGFLPGKSYMVMAQNMPPEAVTPYMSRYVDLVATAWKLKELEKGEFAKLYAELVTYFGPDAAFGIYSDSSFPLAMTSVTQTTNGLRMRDKLYEFYGMALQKVIEDLPQEQRKLFASGSIKQVVDSFAPVLQNLGVTIQMDTEDYRESKVDYIVITLDWGKINLPPSAAWVQDIIKSRIGGALGFSANYLVGTFGPNPVVRVKEVLDGTRGLKLSEMVGPEVEEGKYVAVFALSFAKLLAGLLDIPAVKRFADAEPWLARMGRVREMLVLGGPLDERGLWVEARVGVKSIIEAFKEPIQEAIEADARKHAPPPAPPGE